MANGPRIGFIGLGRMGSAMARRLVDAGRDVTVYNRTASKAQELAARGAQAARSPAELADRDLVVTMLADDRAVEEAVEGPQGFGRTLKKGAVHIAMSTISVDLSRRLSERHAAAGQGYVAAPVLGRPDAAAAGKLYIFAAGADAAACEPVFSAVSQRVFPVAGDAWRAHLVKLACNFMLASAIETMAEAFALTRKGGVDPQAFYEIFSGTLFAAPAYKNYGAMISERRYVHDAGFKMTLASKDLRLVLAAAEGLRVPMPTASLIREQMMLALGRGDEALDWSALGKIAAENAGLD